MEIWKYEAFTVGALPKVMIVDCMRDIGCTQMTLLLVCTSMTMNVAGSFDLSGIICLGIAQVVSGSDLMTVPLMMLVPLKDQTEHSIVVT